MIGVGVNILNDSNKVQCFLKLSWVMTAKFSILVRQYQRVVCPHPNVFQSYLPLVGTKNTIQVNFVLSRTSAPGVLPFGFVLFLILTAIHAYTLTVVSMLCLQYLFYSLRLLQKHRVWVKGHQNNSQTRRNLLRPTVLKFLDPSLFEFGIYPEIYLKIEDYILN